MAIVQQFRARMLGCVEKFTWRWWNDRPDERYNFHYHVDDKFYETVLREEAEELLEIVFDLVNDEGHDRLEEWARVCSGKRATQGVPIEESVERFRMFRHILMDYLNHFAEEQGLGAVPALRLAEALNNACELAMQLYMAFYRGHKEQYFNEQKRRFDVERLASIGQMAAGVAHEVRNPLTATRGFLQLLQETAPHHFLDIAMGELDRGIQIISTLLEVAKPAAPTVPKRPLSVAMILQQVMDLFHDKLYDKVVRIEFRDEDARVEGWPEMLKQAFFNVIKNALEAMRDSEVKRITLRHFRREDHLVVEVADTGGGIPASKLHLLGTPFFTLKDTGVGLGLTMVYRVMHEHFAEVTVESAEGEGTCFRFTFPLGEL